MKSVFNVSGMKTPKDVLKIKQVIAGFEGVIACEISRDKGEINIIYDNYFVTEEEFIASLEELGYIVL